MYFITTPAVKSKEKQDNKSAEDNKSAVVQLLRSSKDKAVSTPASAIFAGVASTAGLLTMAYGAINSGSLGVTEIVLGGTTMLMGIVIAIIPKKY